LNSFIHYKEIVEDDNGESRISPSPSKTLGGKNYMEIIPEEDSILL